MIDAARLALTSESSVTFLGRVLPAESNITIPLKLINWTLNSDALARLHLRIENSTVRVDCEIGGAFELGDVYRRALDLAQSVADLICFAKGLCLTVVFERILHDGKEAPLAIGSPDVQAFCTSFRLDQDFDAILQLVITEPALAVALNDLNVALAHHHLSPVNYARAMEAVRVMIAGADEPMGKAWERMRTALRIDRAYLQLITDSSADKRHGNHQRIEGAVVEQISERSWRIMDRFLAYRLGCNEDLDESHPLLRE